MKTSERVRLLHEISNRFDLLKSEMSIMNEGASNRLGLKWDIIVKLSQRIFPAELVQGFKEITNDALNDEDIFEIHEKKLSDIYHNLEDISEIICKATLEKDNYPFLYLDKSKAIQEPYEEIAKDILILDEFYNFDKTIEEVEEVVDFQVSADSQHSNEVKDEDTLLEEYRQKFYFEVVSDKYEDKRAEIRKAFENELGDKRGVYIFKIFKAFYEMGYFKSLPSRASFLKAYDDNKTKSGRITQPEYYRKWKSFYEEYIDEDITSIKERIRNI